MSELEEKINDFHFFFPIHKQDDHSLMMNELNVSDISELNTGDMICWLKVFP